AELGPAEAAEPARQLEELSATHPGVEARVLVEIAEPSMELRPIEASLDPGDGGAPGRRLRESGQDPDRRGLARPVRAEQPEDRAGRNIEIEPIERQDGPVSLRQAPRHDRRLGA